MRVCRGPFGEVPVDENDDIEDDAPNDSQRDVFPHAGRPDLLDLSKKAGQATIKASPRPI